MLPASSPMLNMGRNMAATMVPTMVPMTTMTMGSMSEVNHLTAVSTSWS